MLATPVFICSTLFVRSTFAIMALNQQQYGKSGNRVHMTVLWLEVSVEFMHHYYFTNRSWSTWSKTKSVSLTRASLVQKLSNSQRDQTKSNV